VKCTAHKRCHSTAPVEQHCSFFCGTAQHNAVIHTVNNVEVHHPCLPQLQALPVARSVLTDLDMATPCPTGSKLLWRCHISFRSVHAHPLLQVVLAAHRLSSLPQLKQPHTAQDQICQNTTPRGAVIGQGLTTRRETSRQANLLHMALLQLQDSANPCHTWLALDG
jgi:hypothetical protein